jgi:hypothetical protein
MARRWVRFEMPVMVCVEVDEQFEGARVLMVVARGSRGHNPGGRWAAHRAGL